MSGLDEVVLKLVRGAYGSDVAVMDMLGTVDEERRGSAARNIVAGSIAGGKSDRGSDRPSLVYSVK